MSGAQVVDPRRLDVARFANANARWTGEFALAEMPRLLQDTLPPSAGHERVVLCALQGERRTAPGTEAEIRLHLRASTALQLRCQRCLQPVTVKLDVRPTLRFVRDEVLAERLDQADEEDVLVLGAALDLRELVEDELILALPLVPRHDTCPQPLPTVYDASDAPQPPAQPFAALEALRRGSGQG